MDLILIFSYCSVKIFHCEKEWYFFDLIWTLGVPYDLNDIYDFFKYVHKFYWIFLLDRITGLKYSISGISSLWDLFYIKLLIVDFCGIFPWKNFLNFYDYSLKSEFKKMFFTGTLGTFEHGVLITFFVHKPTLILDLNKNQGPQNLLSVDFCSGPQFFNIFFIVFLERLVLKFVVKDLGFSVEFLCVIDL